MALIGTLRDKMGKIVVGAIMLTMVAFIGTDLIGSSTLLGGGQNQDIAEIAGNPISNDRFQSKLTELSNNFALNAGRAPMQQEVEQIRNQVWNALILEEVYEAQFAALGIEVTGEELLDMVQGTNISPQIVQFFTDPNTGQFDKANITNYLASLQQAPEQQRMAWINFERSLIPARSLTKYNNLFAKTNYVTKYEAKQAYVAQNSRASISYAYVPFLVMPDSLVTVTDKELKSYIEDHAEEFQKEETKNLEYVVFNIYPSASDSAAAVADIQDLQSGLAASTDDSTFVSINSDDPYGFLTYNQETLPEILQDAEVGFVSEPTISNGVYELYKLSRVQSYTRDSIEYKVARIKKDISLYISDETIDAAYRKADYFAASCGNVEEFRSLAGTEGLAIQKGNRVDKNAQRVGMLSEARGLVMWAYNEAATGAVSDVKEIGDQYIVAAMVSEQGKGVANLAEVRNQVARKVRNEKKAQLAIDKFNSLEAGSVEELAASYGSEAKSGTVDFQMLTNSVSGLGFAPEVIGLAFSLDEEETTGAFALQDGVIVMTLDTKDLAEEQEEYAAYVQQVAAQRTGGSMLIADFPLSFFGLVTSRDIDQAVKEFAEIEDLRYKFF